MKYIIVSAAALGLAAAKSERVIISYDEQSWNTMSLKYLPSNTVSILKELRMQVADLDMEEIKEFGTLPGVNLYKNRKIRLFGENVQKNPPSWGIDRLDQQKLPLDKQYRYDSTGKGVDVWVIDTGINAEHVEFEGRATLAHNFSGDNKDTDCYGHGTHVASTIAGKTVGVAKQATIRAVKVFSCDKEEADDSTILAAMNFVVAEHKKVAGRKSVINMSLGGEIEGETDALIQAVKAVTDAGITVVVAAGNDNKDANKYSPAAAPEAITVAASDRNDVHARFSNWGSAVDIYAPGVDIKGAWIGGKNAYKNIQGTSMASPHVAGVSALILARGDATTPAEVKAVLKSSGTKGVIKSAPAKTPNTLLYSLKASTSTVATFDSYPTAEVMNLVK